MIDNTVYCEWASPEDLLAHLPEGWREFATGGGGNVALLPARPTLNPDGERQAALMAGEEGVPFPGRRLEDVQRMLDVQGIERAVLTPGPVLRGSTIRNHYYALAINRAANDWMIDACLGGSDRRLFGTLVVSNRLPGEAATEIRRLGANDRIVAVTMAGGGLGKLYGHPVYHPIYEAAADLDLPVVIHCRDAEVDLIRTLEDRPAIESSAGIWHCFSGSEAAMQAAVRQGYYISFAGTVTFKNAGALRAVAEQVPDERLLLETDSPYLSPSPHRGQRNEPARVRLTAELVADLRQTTLGELADVTTTNATRLFRWKSEAIG